MNYNQDIGRLREILPRVFIMKFTMPCGSPQDILARTLENVICLHFTHILTPLRELSVAKKMLLLWSCFYFYTGFLLCAWIPQRFRVI